MNNVVVVDGVRLAYRTDGPEDAPALVMVNSLGTNLHMWDPQIVPLSRHLRIVRYDCRGHGASDVPPEPYTIEQFGLDLLALLDTLQIERAHICGLSLGGMVALWLSVRYPQRVSRAIFANTAARIGSVPMWETRMDAVNTGGMGAIRDASLARFLSEEFRGKHPEVVQKIGEMIEAINPRGYMGACAALRDADLHALLAAIHVPSLIIASTLDESTPLFQSQELHAAIAGSELVILRQAAHLSNVEQSEEFSKAMSTFLAHS
ncbi:MAG TPA: 3-oxoadipate enol-lactonase [Ktedonobacteraceae bacterium]|jgi:3-oxoadipate enol-lactonase|nr:3-oxoadipate enol-lactonase [Ktedonobacteraceae bacterium]